jgi:Type I phosphodiesterase / nucleotide pyrophosphatase
MTTRLAKAGLVTLIGALTFGAYPAAQDTDVPYARVLLISIDGMHASDLDWYVSTHPFSTLASLTAHGRTYTNAAATRPSDSFPGMLAMVTGGTPHSTGVYYDDSWDRSLSVAGAPVPPCPAGAEVTWKQNLDVQPYPAFATFNDYAAYWRTHAGAIDPARLPRDPAAGCARVFPHQYPRVNNVFEVIKAAGGRTAWSDKHPAYEFLNGPSGTGLDDLYTPEIAIPPVTGITITNSFYLTMQYDNLKAEAIVHEIQGLDHSGLNAVGVPTLFGMNFQAVSVGQKLKAEQYPSPPADSTLVGGYAKNLDGTLTPKNGLQAALDNTDAAIGSMVAALNGAGLADSTLVIISAKHGNSPMDPTTLVKLPVSSITNIVTNALGPGLVAQVSADTGPLVWLTPAGQLLTTQIADAFNNSITSGNPAHLQGVLTGSDLIAMFADPATDPRAPDMILFPVPGTVYTTSGSKIADHGSFNDDDVHVALLVANPALPQKTINDPVETRQIACTILHALAMDCDALQSEQVEPSRALPNSDHKNADTSSGPSPSKPNKK